MPQSVAFNTICSIQALYKLQASKNDFSKRRDESGEKWWKEHSFVIGVITIRSETDAHICFPLDD